MARRLVEGTLWRRLQIGSTRRRPFSSTRSLPRCLGCHNSRHSSSTVRTSTVRNNSSTSTVRNNSSTSTVRNNSSTAAAPDYTRDDGLVEGVWIFSRHGDRTPSRSLVPAHHRAKEGAYWVAQLPSPDSAAAYEAYAHLFPLQVPQNVAGEQLNGGRFLDARRNPFGLLTQDGLVQCKDSGQAFFNRYNHHGRHLPGQSVWEHAHDFLRAFDVRVYSTNYLRTVLTAQSFLDGLLGTHCFATKATSRPYVAEYAQEVRLPHHAWQVPGTTSSSSVTNDETPLVSVTLRELSRDPLNAFDRNPDLMADLVAEVMATPDFYKRDAAAAPLAGRLANVLPGLIRPRRADFSSRSPSGINWVDAADHFVCRDAHGLPLAQFSDFEDDDRVEQTLRAMASQTKTHLAWRFRQWYKNRKLLGAIAGPPLREVWDQIRSTPSLSATDKRRFTFYSCHDITILGLLYGVGASFLADDNNPEWLHYWPPYASTLVLELVRTDEDEHVVRILLDGQHVKSVDYNDPQFRPLSTAPDGLLQMEDFGRMVELLEEDGGSCARL